MVDTAKNASKRAPPGDFYWAGIISIVLFSLLLSSCGFHLKGLNQVQANYQSIKIVDEHLASTDVQRELRQQFAGMGVRVVKSLSDADLELTLMPTQLDVSVTGRTGKGDVSSELLKMSQSFKVNKVASEEELLDATVISFRDRNVSSGLLQASSRELRSIKRQMSADICLKIVKRINYSLEKDGTLTK